MGNLAFTLIRCAEKLAFLFFLFYTSPTWWWLNAVEEYVVRSWCIFSQRPASGSFPEGFRSFDMNCVRLCTRAPHFPTSQCLRAAMWGDVWHHQGVEGYSHWVTLRKYRLLFIYLLPFKLCWTRPQMHRVALCKCGSWACLSLCEALRDGLVRSEWSD